MGEKTIVVTGATKGIGRAVAERFAREGFSLAVCARSGTDLEAMEQDLKSKYKFGESLFLRCDVSNAEELQHFAETVLLKYGAVDVLVNNAGVFLPGLVHHEEEGRLEETMNTNLYSLYRITRLLLPKMMERQSGHIFNLGSVAGIKEYPNGGAYSVSKFAVHGFGKALREEMKPYGIKVTTVIPGATYTDSWKNSGLPESRFMQAADVAEMIWSAYNLSAGAVVEEILMRPMLGDI